MSTMTRSQHVARLHQIAAKLNSFYPRPVGSLMTFDEERLRAEAREHTAAIKALDHEEE